MLAIIDAGNGRTLHLHLANNDCKTVTVIIVDHQHKTEATITVDRTELVRAAQALK